MRLYIKEDIDLKELEKYGFEEDTSCPSKIKGLDDYTCGFLRVDIANRDITISSGYDEVNGNKELLKFYELVQNGLIEKR